MSMDLKFGRAARPRKRGIGAELAELERTNPDVALAAHDLDRITAQLTGLPEPAWRARNNIAVAHAAAEKRKREAEADAWIAEVRARPGVKGRGK